jgi:hypothetical protein
MWEAPETTATDPLLRSADRAAPVLKLRDPDSDEMPAPVVTATYPPRAAVPLPDDEPALIVTSPPLPTAPAPAESESEPASPLVEVPTATTRLPAAPDAVEPLAMVMRPLSPRVAAPVVNATAPLVPSTAAPEATATLPLLAVALPPLLTLTWPLPPLRDPPDASNASPELRPTAVASPVTKDRIPDPLDAPLPVTTATVPPRDDAFSLAEDPATIIIDPPSEAEFAPPDRNSVPAFDAEPPTDTATSPDVPTAVVPVLRVRLPVEPDTAWPV